MSQKSKEIWEQTFACSQDWDAMPGDARTRYCGHCDRHLVNLSTMTQDEAIAWMHAHDEDFCGVLEIVGESLVFAPPKLPPAPARLAALAFPMLLACQEPSVAVSQPAVVSSENSSSDTPMAPSNSGAAQVHHTSEDDRNCDGLEDHKAAELGEYGKQRRKALAMAEIAVDLGVIRACSDRVTLVCPKEVAQTHDPEAPFASDIREGKPVWLLNERRKKRLMGKLKPRPEPGIQLDDGPQDF